MVRKLYTVFDVRAEMYGPPISVAHEVEAKRAFTQIVNEPGTPVSQYPEDFKLVFIGEFNDATGVISGVPVPETICFGNDVLRKVS